MYGWMGIILRVDLTSGKIEKEPLSEYLGVNYVGGRGINTRILYDMIKPGIDPLGPENVLIFGTGPLTGTAIASGRFNVSAKSPLTNILADSNAGGHFSPELKYAGYDHIVFTGKADKPVYLWIDNDDVELRDARHLWGKTIDETDRMLKEEIGDPRIQMAYIGPAGENLVRVASVLSGLYWACGRTGTGAVMGSKNLKAIAVRGTKGIKIAQPELFRTLTRNLQQRLMGNMRYPTFNIYGTTELFDKEREAVPFTIKNAREADGSDRFDEMFAKPLEEKYAVKNRACFGCVNHCQHFFEIKEGPYAGEKGGGVEYLDQILFGPFCDCTDAATVYKCHNLCNQYGLDTFETGALIALAMDWYDLGLITKEDTGGLELTWGNSEAMVALCQQMAKREEFGDVLAEGSLRAAEKVGKGALECISHSKGALMPFGDYMRANKAYLLGEATSTRGACHLRGAVAYRPGLYIDESMWKGPPLGPWTDYENQAGGVRYVTTIATMADALEICKFITVRVGQEVGLKDMAELFSAATGVEKDEAEMQEVADRIWLGERAFLVREGITRADDAAVGRLTREPGVADPFKGIKHDQKKWDKMLDEFYDMMGLDKNGIPARARLESLGLKDIADELEGMGKM